MSFPRWCDFDKLVEVVTSQFYADAYSVHGPRHWRCVEQNGLRLARRTGADVLVVRLFAWFHDSRRENDFTDPAHGRRGAAFAASLRGECFELEDAAFETLSFACAWHTDKVFSEDPTVGTCWDADRLDLGRVGIIPSGKFMSTDFGKEVAAAGSFQPWADET